MERSDEAARGGETRREAERRGEVARSGERWREADRRRDGEDDREASVVSVVDFTGGNTTKQTQSPCSSPLKREAEKPKSF